MVASRGQNRDDIFISLDDPPVHRDRGFKIIPKRRTEVNHPAADEAMSGLIHRTSQNSCAVRNGDHANRNATVGTALTAIRKEVVIAEHIESWRTWHQAGSTAVRHRSLGSTVTRPASLRATVDSMSAGGVINQQISPP